ncbi:MAG TPA: hypothetical protein VF988_02170, partial [Verrucomicrobiae bacterium]
LGKFFAAKFRSGVLFAIYQLTQHRPALEKAIETNQAARAAWANLAESAKGVYRDDVTFGPEYFQRGHWLDRLPALDADIADMKKLLTEPRRNDVVPPTMEAGAIKQAIQTVFAPATLEADVSPWLRHVPVGTFRRGQPLDIVARIRRTDLAKVELRYRRLNQAESWQTVIMTGTGERFSATIPAEYTDSVFPLQYYFHARGRSETWLVPGLRPGWKGQPYYVLRQGI